MNLKKRCIDCNSWFNTEHNGRKRCDIHYYKNKKKLKQKKEITNGSSNFKGE
jgi:hypothetical protein